MTDKLKPLRLSWRLGSPLVTTGNPIHLDALVAYAQTQQKLAMMDVGETPTDLHIRALADDLPIAKEERAGAWVWKASALVPAGIGPITQGMRFFTRRTDVYDLAEREGRNEFETRGQRDRRLAGKHAAAPKPLKPYGGRIDTARGLLKNVFKHYPTKQIKELNAWCVGNPEELDALLNPAAGFVSYIGARRRSGHGVITDFQIVEDDAALELWSSRVLPWEHASSVPMELACRPPYWAPENRELNFVNPALFI